MAFKALSRAIRDTLLEHGEVGLPGLGILRLEYRPARLSRIESLIYPPSRSPVFEAGDVGLPQADPLEYHYSLAAGDSAEFGASSAVDELQRVVGLVENGEVVELPDVGNFYLDARNAPEFVASAFNYDLEMYGLGPVQARLVQRRTAAEAAALAMEARGHVPGKPVVMVRKKNPSWRLPLLAAVLLLLLGSSLWLLLGPPVVVSPAGSEKSVVEADTLDNAAPEGYVPEGSVLAGSDIIDTSGQEIAEEEDGAPQAAAGTDPSAAEAQGTILAEVVVGHFRDAGNVTGAIQRLERLGLEGRSIPGPQGLTRVLATVRRGGQSPQEVLAIVKTHFDPQAWILVPGGG